MYKPVIMMVTYNRLELTKRTFEGALKNAGCNYNLIVVDNGSTDDSVEWICDNSKDIAYIDKCVVISTGKNKGIANGRNKCLKIMSTDFNDSDYLCTLDNDVILPDNWLKDCCDVLSSKHVGVLACGVNLECKPYSKAQIKLNDGRSICIQIKSRGNLGTACGVMHKRVFDKIGYFDMLETYAHEDALMYLRARLAFKGIVCYLGKDGEHIGVGENDSGEYREMKNEFWDKNMPVHNRLASLYMSGRKSLKVDFEE